MNEDWKKMLKVECGADITKMKAPIPITIGEGYTFRPNDDEYITVGYYNKEGKRNVIFYITPSIGYNEHSLLYFCHIDIRVGAKCGRYTSLVTPGWKVPDEFKSIVANVVRPLTKEELAWWPCNKEGDPVRAFRSLGELNKCIKAICKIFQKNKWNISIYKRKFLT